MSLCCVDESISLFLTPQEIPGDHWFLSHLSFPGVGRLAAARLLEIALTLWLGSGDPALWKLYFLSGSGYF